MCAPSPKRAWSAPAPTGSRSSRCSAIRLGIPIPHTGIVPRNKARIGAALGRFITNNFLTPKVLSEKLVKVDAAQWVADWLADPDNARSVAHRAAVVVPEIVRALPRDVMADALGRSLVAGLKAVPAGPVAANLLGIVWAQGETQKLLDRAITVAEAALIANKAFIRARVEANSSRWVPRWLDGMVADKITSTIAATLTEMRDPAHPWRVELKDGIEGLIGRLGTDPSLQADVEAAKNAFLDDPGFAEHVTVIWKEIDARLPSDVSAHADTIATGGRALPPERGPLDRRGPGGQGEDQHLDPLPRAAHHLAAPRRDRRLRHQRGGGVGLDDPRQPAGAAGRQGPAIHPHQRHAGRRPRRAHDLHGVEVVLPG